MSQWLSGRRQRSAKPYSSQVRILFGTQKIGRWYNALWYNGHQCESRTSDFGSEGGGALPPWPTNNKKSKH